MGLRRAVERRGFKIFLAVFTTRADGLLGLAFAVGASALFAGNALARRWRVALVLFFRSDAGIIFAFIAATPCPGINSPFAKTTLRREGGARNGNLPAAVMKFFAETGLPTAGRGCLFPLPWL
jgi:hypothetical protein